MIIDKIINIFSTKQKDIFILVREGNQGLETFISENLVSFHPAYKKQLIEFLKETINILEGKKQK